MRTPTAIRTGDLLGYVGKDHGFDFWAVDPTFTLPGIVRPDHYDLEPTYVHSLDPLPLFVEPVRRAILARNGRDAEPRGGKIDYDIDGRLVGSWFVEGVGGMKDRANPTISHLRQIAFAYDPWDPTQLRVSIGDWQGKPRQCGVKGNAPDPATVGTTSGAVKFECVAYLYYRADTGEPWRNYEVFTPHLRGRNDDRQLFGTVLVQLVADRRLRVEVFPGRMATEVTGFTEGARMYER